MKNVASIVLTCALVLIFATPAFCDDNKYLSLFVGVFQGEDSEGTVEGFGNSQDVKLKNWDPGYIGGVAVGKQSWKWRVDAEYAFGTILGDDEHDTDLLFHMFSGNIHYDFVVDKMFTPYISLGVGLGIADISGDYEGDNTNFAFYQFGAGVSFDITEKISLDARYRYLNTTDLEFEDSGVTFTFDMTAHTALAGIRFNF